jgi:hypothetical protein
MLGIPHLLSLVDEYRRVREVSDARVSTLVFNDGSRIAQLRDGRDIGTRRLDRAIQWFSDHWPEGADWPAVIVRPEVSDLRETA